MFNVRKLQILRHIDAHDEAVSRDAADALNISLVNAAVLLLGYHKMGLLFRRSGDRFNRKIYQLTEEGRRRLKYLTETIERSDDEHIEDDDFDMNELELDDFDSLLEDDILNFLEEPE